MKITLLALLLTLYSFGQPNPACGRTIAAAEMEVLSQEIAKRYSYKDSDLDVQVDINTEIMALYKDNYIFEVFFFMKDRRRIGIQIVGSFNDEIKEKISCHLLATKIKGLPDTRFLLFYDVDSKAMVYSVTNEK